MLYFAQIGSISGMEKAIEKNPEAIYESDVSEQRSALHYAAESASPTAAKAVQWLLEKGVPWGAQDTGGLIPEDLARMHQHQESSEILRTWAVQKGESTDIP